MATGASGFRVRSRSRLRARSRLLGVKEQAVMRIEEGKRANQIPHSRTVPAGLWFVGFVIAGAYR